MKKLLFVIMLLLLLSFPSYAAEDIGEDLSERLFSDMDDEISSVLSDFGITSFDYETVYNFSFGRIAEYYKDSLTDYLQGAVRLFSEIFSMIMLFGATSLIIQKNKHRQILSLLLVPVVTVLLVDEINLCINSAVSLLKLNGSFMLAFVPVYAIAVSVAGNPAAAVTYNTLVLAFAEAISAVINYGIIDAVGCFFCVCIGLSVNSDISFPRFLGSVNRLISFVFGLLSSLFASFLSVKGIFAASTDSVTSKGIRFAMGSLIPVIGSSLSDAYSTLVGSFSVLKGSVAIVGILAVILINFPVVTEMLIFNLSLNALSFISELFDCNELSNILKAFATGIKFIGLMILFEAFILIISTAVMLTLKGG